MPDTMTLPSPGLPTEPGYLTAQVIRYNSAFPLSYAAVRVFHPDGRLLYDVSTDSSGLTPAMELDAPSPVYSAKPQRERRPYAEYIMEASCDGSTIRFEGVQVYPASMAIQQADFTRVLQQGPGAQQVISIDDNTLWGSYPPYIKEFEYTEAPALNPQVLPQVVIPEFVIVHDGSPNDAGSPNYQIAFTDYIKNVASGVTYPTWPTAALESNILAILSLTLNRVYTEWYRGKGHPFTITSSTAYDQKFTYGRTIYRKTARIVDRLFVNYLKRQGASQPMFAQYCDGSRVVCPGSLSQWGGKMLAEQGYNAGQILRNYYGNDILVESALRVSGAPEPYPGTSLSRGSRGESVRWVQEQLNVIRKNFPVIPGLAIDGIFGPLTEQSVLKFQNIFKLVADGIVGIATWYRISRIYTDTARLPQL